MAATVLQRRRDVRHAYGRKLRANKTPEYIATRDKGNRNYAPKLAARNKLAVEQKLFHRDVCNISIGSMDTKATKPPSPMIVVSFASQPDSPPSINRVLSLSTDIPTKTWGIYVLVHRKGDHFKLRYIGSGTGTVNNGVRYRVMQHKRRDAANEPVYVEKAKSQGYEQVHEPLLAWCDRPRPAQAPAFHAAIVAIEAAFHFIFWPMYTRTTRYT